MLQYPKIDPVALSLGPLKIHWYGLMYLVGFAAAWWLGMRRSRQPGAPMDEQGFSDVLFYSALGVVLGGRIGYILFYSFGPFLHDPLSLFRVWEGGMSFHGGLLGVITAMAWFGYKQKLAFFTVADFIAPLVPIGLGAGRIGNFIGGELWGRVSDVPWAMAFPRAGLEPRHPSQLYEFFLEGVVMFSVLWWFSSTPRARGAVSGLFLVLYGSFRFLVEFVREPDIQLGYLALNWVTMGQILSFPMILLGLGLLVAAGRRGVAAGGNPT